MESNHLRELLASARKTFDETGQIPDKLKQAIAQCCSKQYILDFIAELGSMPTSSGFLRTLSGCWKRQSERMWYMVILLMIRPPSSDPIRWLPGLEDYRHLDFLLDEAESLDIPREDLVALVHYPLARLVDDVLMSGAFAGCGMKTVEEWRTPAWYDCLLKEKLPPCTARGLTPVTRAQALIARISRILENHGLPRLRLGVGAATLYYGLRDESLRDAKEALILCLLNHDLGPHLLYIVREGILVPSDGVLVPNLKRVEEVEHCPSSLNGVLGPQDSTLFVQAIRGVDGTSTGEGFPTGDVRVDECIASYVRWHESLGLLQALEAALAQ